MKHPFLILLIAVCTSNASAQIILSQPELFIFYRGYDNKLDAAAQNGIKTIHLSGPHFQFQKQTETRFIARATGEVGTSKIYMTNAKNGDTIDVFDVEVRNLPDPQLFFGGMDVGGTINAAETRFFAKYGPEIPLNVSFTILEGYLTLSNGEKISFTGSKLSEQNSRALQDCKFLVDKGLADSTVHGDFTVKGPDGVKRIIHGVWKL